MITTAPLASPGGGNVVVANRASGTLSAIGVRTDEVIATVDMPDAGEPMHAYYAPEMRRVLVGDPANDRGVALDARTLKVEGFGTAGAGVFHMWGSTGLGPLWVNNDIDNTTSIIDTHSLETLATMATPPDLVVAGGKPQDGIVGPQGQFAYVTVIGVDGPMDHVVQFDTSAHREVARAAVGGRPPTSR
jgi:DNA-binding beta-propeller fold protein YncE